MSLEHWAARWGVSPLALAELRMMMGAADFAPPVKLNGTPGSETRQQGLVRLEAADKGVWLTRNNVGATKDERGVLVRYGLCNESSAQNERIKSSDLIGIRPILIGPQHVGKVIGQFVARECKKEGWRYTGTGREPAQLRFIEFVTSKGGDAAFASGPGTLSPPQR